MIERRTSIPMCMWAAEDLPTVKAQNTGYRSLTTAELLSIIIGSGTMSENAVDLSRRLLVENNNSLKKLSSMRLKDMTSINGIGEIKASKVLAALELGNRMNMESVGDAPDVGTATRVYHFMKPHIAALDEEEFWVLYMNLNYRLIAAKRVSHGGLNETLVDVRVIMREAVLCNATVITVCHNHPSGKITPSSYDDDITYSLQRACKLMDIHFLDHVIVVDGMYYSYHEQGRV